MEHPAVAEAGVIGKPDPVAGEIVKAFVALKPGYEPSDELRRELLGFARKRLGAAVAPQEIEFVDRCRSNRSGKIMRRLLKARELGLPEGDISTLEEPSEHERRHDRNARGHRPRARTASCCARCCGSAASRRSASELYSAGQDPRLPAPLHRRGGGRGRRDAGARRRTTRSSRPTASTATRSCAACPAGAVMAEMYGKAKGCSRGRGGSMHLFDAATPLLRRQRDRRRRAAARRRPGARRQAARPRAGDRLLLRRRRGRRGRVPRVAEPRRAVAAAGAVLCENNLLRDGHRASSATSPQTDLALKAASYEMPAGRSTAWTCSRSRRRRAARPPTVRDGERPVLPGAAHLPLPRPLDVRPGALPQQGRDRALEASATRSALLERAAARAGLLDDADVAEIEQPVARGDRRRRRVRRGGHAASRSRTCERTSTTPRRRHDARHDHHLPRGDARRRSARRCIGDERVFLMGEDVGALRRLLRASARACSRSSAPSGSATRRCRSRRSSAPGSARRWAACGRSSRS